MAKKRITERDRELVALIGWCTIVKKQFLRMSSNDPLIVEFATVVDAAVQARKVGQLRSLKRDLMEWIRTLNAQQQKEIDEALQTELGRGLGDETRAEEKKVEEILRRGSIQSEDEYRLLSAWLELIQGDASKQAELEKIDALLTEFGARIH